MATKKDPVERKFVSVSKTAGEVKESAAGAAKAPESAGKTPKGRATGLRVFAVILWLVAFAFEFLVIALIQKMIYIPGDMTMWLIIGIVADLVCVIIGSLLWKKANHIDPASEKNKVRFFLWNNMGVIAAIVAFVPLIIILLKDKKLNSKTKTLVTIIAAVALVIAGAVSYDYHPASQESLAQAKSDSTMLGDGTAYWTVWGHSYHFNKDCQTLLNSATVYQGTVNESFEAGRTDPCDFCAGGAEAKAAEPAAE